ncbi:AraC family transcriptional regulator [Niallia taxi]|uniref:helix-turn-helix domain-containing protein n=1 Tax=Niallia taxi TaxID=2499688 RepID=UPI002E22ABE8|nr:AraC family transcriptional regulator [Niallia taxi]MED4121834.1 AraC family transcriptional regulator [Niallia taxi]
MKESIFMPVMNENFEIHYWTKTYQSSKAGLKPDESAENYSEIEPLFRLHSHDATEFLIFLGGECEYICEGKTYNLIPGDVVFISPYAVHKANVKDFETYERIVLNISEQLLADYLSVSPAMQESLNQHKATSSHIIHIHFDQLHEISSLLKDVSARKLKDKEHHTFAVQYLLFQAIQVILNPSSSVPASKENSENDQRLLTIINYIETNLTNPDLNLDNVSNHFHLNKYYFSHYFKNNMKVSFYRYVLIKRLAIAVTMIKQNNISIEEIAKICGFQDYSSFYRLFKKEYNISPKNLQKINNNN